MDHWKKFLKNYFDRIDELTIRGPLEEVPKNYFDRIDELTIRKSAKMTAPAGSPDFDSEQFRVILCNNFKSEELEQLARLTN